MSGNIGETSLRRRRRPGDPMAAFDGLPPPLRQWLSQAALPWSPASARRIWSKSLARGLTQEETLVLLSRAEARTLARDRRSTLFKLNSQT
ncbi:MAG: DUF6525 family protein [Rhodobacter sp.]|nr:DUF6525 family protein [Rhodobacter sp.]MCY4167984.1 DUF6525 family protein [Rhodobacter sp.]MCY4242567.1 DUF6525 family protein [Rhodobacter sp.]